PLRPLVALDGLDELHAVEIRHHDVADDEVGAELLELEEAIEPIAGDGDLEAVSGELLEDQGLHRRLVFEDEDASTAPFDRRAHRPPPSSGRASSTRRLGTPSRTSKASAQARQPRCARSKASWPRHLGQRKIARSSADSAGGLPGDPDIFSE